MPRPGERMEAQMSLWFKHWQESKKTEPRERHPPFVTISRESGAYGTTFADMLAEHLRHHDRRREAIWTVFDKELIQKVMEEHQFPAQFAGYFVESPIPLIEDILADLVGLHPPQEILVRRMSETLLHLAVLGYVILVGRGANLITRKLPGGIHVRLVGSFEKRVDHMREYLRLDQKEARDYVSKEDHHRQAYIKQHFRKDISDVLLYDLIINTDTVLLQDAVRIIADMVLKQQERNRSSDLKTRAA